MLAASVFIGCVWILYTRAEFVSIRTTREWQLFQAHGFEGCSYDEKYRRFPELYRMSPELTEIAPEIGPPENYAVTYFEKSEVSRAPNYYYPGMTVEFRPPGIGEDDLRGYELEIYWRNEIYCFVYVLNQVPRELAANKMEEEFFPLHDLMSYWLTVTSLPIYNSSQIMGPVRLVTSRGHYRDPSEVLKEPADWVAIISHYVVKSNESRSLQIVFSRPPEEYGFQRFQIALIPVEDYIHVQSAITTRFYYDFLYVEPGHYKISIDAVDDFFSQTGRCLCHKNGHCTNCLSAHTATFTVQ